MFKKIGLVIVALLVAAAMIFCFASYAKALDQSACTDGRFNADGQVCIGLLQPSDMGSFDDNNVWHWNPAFETEFDGWASNANPLWRTDWAPQTTGGIVPSYSRMDHRHRIGKEADVRFVIQLADADVGVPWLWRVAGTNGEPNSFYGYFRPPVGCECDESGCFPEDICFDQPWTGLDWYSIPGAPVYSSEVQSMSWNNQTVTEFHDYFVTYTYLKYDTGDNVWFSNFSEDSNHPEIYGANFGPNVPATGINTLNVLLKNGQTFDLDFNVTTNEVMPTVPAKTYYTDIVADKVNKKGKIVKASETEVEVDNLIARELSTGALLIQWGEPDGAMDNPGMRLRVYVGDSWGLERPDFDRDTFLFLDCPVQTGSVVVPPDVWGNFKVKMTDLGQSSVYVAGMYRFQPRYTMDNGWKTDYHNRGYFEYITIPVQ